MAFTDKVVVVTGSSSGIGAETAVRFAREGARLTITGRNPQGLSHTKARCIESSNESRILCVEGDITGEDFRRDLISETVAKFGRLGILINNAGVLSATPLGSVPIEEFDEQFDVNVRAVFSLTNLAVPHLKLSKGNIVNVSSTLGQCLAQSPGMVVYCSSKAAVDHMTRACALELAQFGVRVNAVAPGFVKTEITRNFSSEATEAFQKKVIEFNPLKGYISVFDVIEAIFFLCSDKAQKTTGHIYRVDAGCILKGVP